LLIAWVVIAVLALSAGKSLAAPEVETRDFNVLIDGKASGDVHMTINKQEDGSVIMTCDTDIKFVYKIGLLSKTYTYSYRGREVWKSGRVARFDSNCSDDGKRFAIAAAASGEKLHVRVNSDEKTIRGDVWLSSYWAMPENDQIGKTIAILDADNGEELSAKLQFLGVETRSVAGQSQKVNHFRLHGKTQLDLWYDVSGRLIAEDWVEEGHRTQVELNRLRR
jgi:hypothetical protein